LLRRWFTAPLRRLARQAALVEAGRDVPFRATDSPEAAALADALEAMRTRLRAVQAETSRQAAEAAIVNRFTDAVSFAEDDERVARALAGALRALVAPASVLVHLETPVGRPVAREDGAPRGATARRRRPRLADTATVASTTATTERCIGVQRGGSHLVEDPTDPLEAPCPAGPRGRGAVACVPLMALGMSLGTVHLRWHDAGRPAGWEPGRIGRVVDHAALAIANRRLVMELRGMASTDARTGLANTRAFDEALDRTLAGDEPVAVILFDLDHFKAFNDAHGHAAGDEALRTFATIVRANLRDGDLAARYGGEEFAVLLPRAGAAEATAVAERIRRQTESTAVPVGNGARAPLSVSAGIATGPDHGSSKEGLMRAADVALYAAKDAGRNRVEQAWGGVGERPRSGASDRASRTPGARPGRRPSPPAIRRAARPATLGGDLRPITMDVGSPLRITRRPLSDRSDSAPRS
jgi:diguanylate cyclase (GGDEF)-like protein